MKSFISHELVPRPVISVFERVLPTAYTTHHGEEPRPAWDLRGRGNYGIPEIYNLSKSEHITTSCVQPAAHGNPTLGVLFATKQGILKLDGERKRWVGRVPGGTSMLFDLLSVDWHPTNPHISKQPFSPAKSPMFHSTTFLGPETSLNRPPETCQGAEYRH